HRHDAHRHQPVGLLPPACPSHTLHLNSPRPFPISERYPARRCESPISNPGGGRQESSLEQFRGTTIVSVRRGNKVVVGGDGQVSQGNTVMKGNARKVRRLYKDQVLAGFAGGTADAFTLFERFEEQLEKHHGKLVRSAVEL